MMLFWFCAVALTTLALCLVLPALLKPAASPVTPGDTPRSRHNNLQILQDQLTQLDAELAAGEITADKYREARTDIERRVLNEEGLAEKPVQATRAVRTAFVVGVAVPLLALTLYGVLGNPQAVQQADVHDTDGSGVTQAQVEAMVTQLAQRLESQPAGQSADPAAWEMLARSYAALQRFAEADRAYARASELAPGNAQLLADRADVLAMMQGQSAAGEPTRLVQRALQLDPKNLKALALAGSAAFERGDFPAAARFWTQARDLAPPGSEFAAGLERSLEEVRKSGGLPGATAVIGQQRLPSTQPTTTAAAVNGVVSLSPALAGKVLPGDTVFIFARAAQGPRMPLAILRRQASELPLRFRLDDSTAMSADLRLSKFDQVVIGARVSRTGNAMPQSGDLLGEAGPIKTTSSGVTLMIDRVQP